MLGAPDCSELVFANEIIWVVPVTHIFPVAVTEKETARSFMLGNRKLKP